MGIHTSTVLMLVMTLKVTVHVNAEYMMIEVYHFLVVHDRSHAKMSQHACQQPMLLFTNLWFVMHVGSSCHQTWSCGFSCTFEYPDLVQVLMMTSVRCQYSDFRWVGVAV